MVNKNYLQGVTFALINCLSLGILGVTDKVGILERGKPLLFSAQTLVFALLFTLLFTLLNFRNLSTRDFKLSFSDLVLVALIGVFGSGIFVLLRYLGLTESTGTFATLSQIITTTLTALLAWILFKEKLSKSFWLLFAIIIFSMYFVSVGKIAFLDIKKGDLLIILGTFFLASSNIFSKIAVRKVNTTILSLGRLLFAFIFLSAVDFILERGHIFNLTNNWVILSGFLMSAAIIGFNVAIKKIGVTLTTSILMMAPIITMILEYLLLGHHFTLVQVIAALVVVASGIAIIFANNTAKTNVTAS